MSTRVFSHRYPMDAIRMEVISYWVHYWMHEEIPFSLV